MVRSLVLSGVVLFGATLHRVAVADEPKGGKAPPDPTAQLLAKLRQPVTAPTGEMTLSTFLEGIEKRADVSIVVNEAAIKADNPDTVTADMPVRPVRARNASAAVVLRHTLAAQGLTYLVRRDHVEVTTPTAARAEARQAGADPGSDAPPPFPLVSAVYREKPLNEALADLAAEHDLTVVLAPQAADQKAAFVTARLLNVPADRAVELLAVQADLRVVRRGAAFLVTSKDHSDSLFNERQERARQKIELENLRNGPHLGGGQLGQVLPPRPGACIIGLVGNPAGMAGLGGNLGFAGNVGLVGVAGSGGFAGNPGSAFGGRGGFISGCAGQPGNPPTSPPAPR